MYDVAKVILYFQTTKRKGFFLSFFPFVFFSSAQKQPITHNLQPTTRNSMRLKPVVSDTAVSNQGNSQACSVLHLFKDYLFHVEQLVGND